MSRLWKYHEVNKKSKFKTGPNCELILTSYVEDSGDATLVPRCSQEHPELGEKKLYIIIKFFLFVYPLKKFRNTLKLKLGTP